MADETNTSGNFEDPNEIFRNLQGQVSTEQFQAWRNLNEQTSRFLQQNESCESGVDSDMLLSPTLLANLPVPQCSTDEDGDTITELLPAAHVLGFLSSNQQAAEKVHEEEDENAMNLADAVKRVTALSQTLKGSGDGSDAQHGDVSAVALQNPEILAKYLTGTMTFEEFFKAVDEKREKTERTRKRKADSSYVYEGEQDFDSDEDQGEPGDDEAMDSEESEEESDKKSGKGSGWNPDVSGFKRKHAPRRRPYDLPKSLQGLMGAATHNVAHGEYEEAIKMCSEIIRQAPRASDPYRMLCTIYNELGETAKATEFMMIFAYMRRNDENAWITLVGRLLEQNDVERALQCLNQAITFSYKVKPKLKLVLHRCSLYEQMGETNKALLNYSQALSYMEGAKTDDDSYLKLARKVCEKYYDQNKITEAIKVITSMFNARPSLVNSEDVNRLLDLQVELKQYQACLEAMVDYCGVVVTLDNHGDLNDASLPAQWSQNSPLPAGLDLKTMPDCIISVSVPDNIPGGFPLELLSKLCICLIYLGFSPQAQHLVAGLLKENVEEEGNGYRFLDVADAYMETNQRDKALPILKRCVESEQYSLAAVWLRYGECLSSVGELQEAIEAFSRVVELAPSHLGARVSLSALQHQIGRHEEALQALSAEDEGGSGEGILEDQRLLLHKCNLLHSQKRNAEFIASSRRLLFSYINTVHNPQILRLMLHFRNIKHRKEALLDIMKTAPETYNMYKVMGEAEDGRLKKDKTSDKEKDENAINAEDLWSIFLKLCNVYYLEKRLDELNEVAILIMSHPVLGLDLSKIRDSEFFVLTTCILNKDGQSAYYLARDFCMKYSPTSPMAWNIFTQCLLFMSDLRHQKSCIRQLIQVPDHPALAMLTGHNSMTNGNYRYALGEYISVFRQAPTNPLVHLCLGQCYVHIACQKFTPRRDWVILQGLAFLNSYLSLRGECQEAYYNVGRALQQLDLGYAAVYYYKKALDLRPSVESSDGVYDLTRESAFNLSLIYRKSGNLELAKLCIQNFIVV